MVDCPSSGVQQVFLCRKWLADDEGDRLIERELYESEDMRLMRRPSASAKCLFICFRGVVGCVGLDV